MLNDNPSTVDWIVKSGHYIPERRLISSTNFFFSRGKKKCYYNLITDFEDKHLICLLKTCMGERERNKQVCGYSSNYMSIVFLQCWTIIRSKNSSAMRICAALQFTVGNNQHCLLSLRSVMAETQLTLPRSSFSLLFLFFVPWVIFSWKC